MDEGSSVSLSLYKDPNINLTHLAFIVPTPDWNLTLGSGVFPPSVTHLKLLFKTKKVVVEEFPPKLEYLSIYLSTPSTKAICFPLDFPATLCILCLPLSLIPPPVKLPPHVKIEAHSKLFLPGITTSCNGHPSLNALV